MTNHTPDPDKLREAWDHAKLLKKSGYLPEELAAMVDVILSLPEPPAPTLADMTPDEREACQWMWADAAKTDGGTVRTLILDGDVAGYVRCLMEDGHTGHADPERVTPRPDLPPLVWPADEPEHGPFPDEEAREDADRLVAAHTDDQPRPEDVPEGEVWLVECRGWPLGVAARSETGTWWGVTTEAQLFKSEDHEITLIRRIEVSQ